MLKNIQTTLFKNTIWLGVGFGVSLVLTTIINSLVARFGGPVVYGNYVLALTYLGFLAVFTDFGISTYAIREISRGSVNFERFKWQILAVKILLAVVGFLIFSLVIYLGSNSTEKISLLIFGASVIALVFNDYVRIVLRAQEMMLAETILRIIERVIFFIFSFISLNLFNGSTLILMIAVSYFLAQIFAGGAALILNKIVYIKTYEFRSLNEIGIKLVIFGSPYLVSGLAWQGYTRTDRLLLERYDSVESVGYYVAAYAVVALMEAIPSLYYQAFFPKLCRRFNESSVGFNLLVKKLLLIFFGISIALACAVYFLAELIIYHMYGNSYNESIQILKIICWSLVFSIPMNLFAYVFPAMNNSMLLTKASAIGALISIVLNMNIIPGYSTLGVSVILVLTQFIVFIYAAYFFFGKFSK